MKLPSFGFGSGFKGPNKIKLESMEQDVPPGYEWNPDNLKTNQPPKEPVVKPKKFATKKRHSGGKNTHQRVQGRWGKQTYRP